jgi:hypothetical protein
MEMYSIIIVILAKSAVFLANSINHIASPVSLKEVTIISSPKPAIAV